MYVTGTDKATYSESVGASQSWQEGGIYTRKRGQLPRQAEGPPAAAAAAKVLRKPFRLLMSVGVNVCVC